MKGIRRIIVVVILLISTVTVFAQQDMTLYYMHRVPQSNLLNPAIQNECKYYFSGILLPIVGQVLPPLHMNYNNNGFAFNQLFYHGVGQQADSMITPFNVGQNPDHFLKQLRKVNYFSAELNIDWLSVGYRWKKWYFTFNLSEKFNFQASIPKGLVTLAWEGNGKSLLGKEADIGDIGAGINWYREYALGASVPINNKLTVGGRAKLLFGKENLWFKSRNLTINTDADDYALTFNTDYDVYSSQQFFDIKKLQMNYLKDSMMFEMDTVLDPSKMKSKDVKKIIMDKHNPGGAIDLGFKYVFNNKITFYGSALDVGFIHYTNHAAHVQTKGEFYFDGWNVQPYFKNNDSVNNAYNEYFKDSVIKIFEPKLVKKSYNYWLTPKIYLGGTYTLNQKLNVGVLLKGDVFLNRLHGGITLSANANLTKWFAPTLSYTIENNCFKQIGAGVLFKIPWMQFYLVTDNVCGFIWPEAARNINFRLGINLLFGCDKKTVSTFIQ